MWFFLPPPDVGEAASKLIRQRRGHQGMPRLRGPRLRRPGSFGQDTNGGSGRRVPISAIRRCECGRWRGTYPFQNQLFASVRSTRGGLMFVGGTNDRAFRAFDAKTGELVWQQKMNSGIIGMPVAYQVGATEHVAMQSGSCSPVGAWTPSESRMDRHEPRRSSTRSSNPRAASSGCSRSGAAAWLTTMDRQFNTIGGAASLAQRTPAWRRAW
jgi:hypothetical protein